MRRIRVPMYFAVAISLLVVNNLSNAADVKVVVDGGQFAELNGNVELYGKSMSVSFSGLPPGKYTVVVEAAENYHDAVGRRIQTVSCGDLVLAKDVDIFKDAGGKGKRYVVKGDVEHKADSLAGPLTVSFICKADNAKFDAIKVVSEDGKVAAEISAAEYKKKEEAFFDKIPEVVGPAIWKDPSKSPEARAADLVSRMTLREKIGQIQMDAQRIPRLDIPAYDWWSECLHGVGRAGTATVFPQAIAAAATWDEGLWQEAATAMSDEARAKHHDFARKHGGESARNYGLDVWSPNVNIFRDPRWGRGHETYGEDPYLTGRFGVAFVKGMQGDDPKYIKIVATPKHFAVHSGPERLRHTFDAEVSDQDLRETYLSAFEACFREGKAFSVMGAYNRFRGESCSSSKLLLIDILRKQWGFSGYSVSDVDSVYDIWATHHVVKTPAEAAARALKNGLDLNSGNTYSNLPRALALKLCTEADIDPAVTRCMIARIRLGMFDPPEMVKYAQIPISVNDSPEHDALALKVAQEAIVLLKNEKNTLPLAKVGKIAVIGPLADDGRTERGQSSSILVGNYNGDPSHPVSILAGIQNKLKGKAEVLYAKGCELRKGVPELEKAALEAAQASDEVIMVMGLSPKCEGEEGEGEERTSLALFPHQEDLIRKIHLIGKPIVLVLTGGSAIAANWEKENIPAMLFAWYPGQRGGDAVADVLFGDYNPAGRLPVTFYKTENDLPKFTDYNMKGRTYRYFTGAPLYGFGHGLSYTTFSYSGMKISEEKDGTRTVSVNVKNTGTLAGDEVLELYISREDAPADAVLPIRSLRGFNRVNLKSGESKTVKFRLTPLQFAFFGKDGVRTVEAGTYRIGIGGSQKAEESGIVTFKEKIADPAYVHYVPEVE